MLTGYARPARRSDCRDGLGAAGAARPPRLSLRLLRRASRRRTAGARALNGALFGLAFDAIRKRTRIDQRRLAIGLAVLEHTALWPALGLIAPEIAKSPRAFAQGVYRHALFGYVLGRLA
jgi:hypothetical protein